MSELRVVHERRIGAPAPAVHRLVADFRNHHHRFLPPQFHDYHVEQGGYGAGTVLSFTSTLGGRPRAMRLKVEEPVPGRVLVERDLLSPMVTTTTVEPDGDGSRVRLETVWTASAGLLGALERLVAPAMMRRMYEDELSRLDRYAREQASAPTA